MPGIPSYTVFKLENKPIVVVRVNGRLKSQAHLEIAIKVCELIEYTRGKAYLVFDLTAARLSFLDTLDVLTQMTRGWRGTPTDPRMITLLALRGSGASLVLLWLSQLWPGWKRVFVFPNLAEALGWACGPIIDEIETTITPQG